MHDSIEALLVTKGHEFEREPFFQMIDALHRPDDQTPIHWTHVEHPAAGALLHPERAAPLDAIVFYDMPGVTFTTGDPPFELYDPSDQYKADFLALLESGKGMVFLHHAIAGWPTWPEYGELLGARFHFLPGELGGRTYPGSGYRFETPQTISVVDLEHPVTAGLGESFRITDEAYLLPVLEDEVVPLLRSDFHFTAENFRYGGVDFESHPEGSNIVAWTKMARRSPIVYLQFGHDRSAYENPSYRKLITNAVRWVASETAAR